MNACKWFLFVLRLQLQEEKTRAIQEKLELCEQKLAQFSKLPEMEEELKQRMEALTQVRAQVGSHNLTVCPFLLYPRTNTALTSYIYWTTLILVSHDLRRIPVCKIKLHISGKQEPPIITK